MLPTGSVDFQDSEGLYSSVVEVPMKVVAVFFTGLVAAPSKLVPSSSLEMTRVLYIATTTLLQT